VGCGRARGGYVFVWLEKNPAGGEELPEIYKDEAYSKSSHWELSTSIREFPQDMY
jgi:hypothetical protein